MDSLCMKATVHLANGKDVEKYYVGSITFGNIVNGSRCIVLNCAMPGESMIILESDIVAIDVEIGSW